MDGGRRRRSAAASRTTGGGREEQETPLPLLIGAGVHALRPWAAVTLPLPVIVVSLLHKAAALWTIESYSWTTPSPVAEISSYVELNTFGEWNFKIMWIWNAVMCPVCFVFEDLLIICRFCFVGYKCPCCSFLAWEYSFINLAHTCKL